MKLSILICTLPERATHYNNMMAILLPQISGKPVEILKDDRPRNIPTGTKRNDLITSSCGEYVCFVDDDDYLASDYVDQILTAAQSNPDCITFKGWMTTNGGSRVDWIIKLGEKYEARKDGDGITRYYRFPNHLVPIKKHIAALIKFPAKWQGEDYEWAKTIHDHKLITSEVHIDKQLYHYKFITHK